MDTGMISKIQKAKMYAEERHRIHVEHLRVVFDGANNPHVVTLDNGVWHCDCDFFHTRNVCSHTMALERILEGIVLEPDKVG
ncbi:MAG: hypothetical protein IT326_10220 [Anaerolineae bacterium]|nr:hypothetical protein [Anaerolineae bacterium]